MAKFTVKMPTASPYPPIKFSDDQTLLSLEVGASESSVVRAHNLVTNKSRVAVVLPGASPRPFDAAQNTLMIRNEVPAFLDQFSVGSGKLVHSEGTRFQIESIVLSANGNRVAFGDAQQEVGVIDVPSQRRGHGFAVPAFAPPLVMDKYGKRVAAVRYNRPGDSLSTDLGTWLDIHDVYSDGPAYSIHSNLAPINWLAITADGKRLAVAGDHGFEFHDIERGTLLTKITAQNEHPWSIVALAPPGDVLATFSNQQITLRDLPTGQHRSTIVGTWRELHIAMFTLFLAGWAIVWGIASKTKKLKSRVAENSSTPLQILWFLMIAGGLAALAMPITFMFTVSPDVSIRAYAELVIGIVAIAYGAARVTCSRANRLRESRINQQ